jgi:hypothetical protein
LGLFAENPYLFTIRAFQFKPLFSFSHRNKNTSTFFFYLKYYFLYEEITVPDRAPFSGVRLSPPGNAIPHIRLPDNGAFPFPRLFFFPEERARTDRGDTGGA